MYRTTLPACDGLTLKAEYPSCQLNSRTDSRSQRLELHFSARTASAKATSGGSSKSVDVILYSAHRKHKHPMIARNTGDVCPGRV